MAEKMSTPQGSAADPRSASGNEARSPLQLLLDELHDNPNGSAKAGQLLRHLREVICFTQAGFGQKVGQHEATIRNWESKGTVTLLKALTFGPLLGLGDAALGLDAYGDICYVNGKRAAVRSLNYILKHQECARTVYVMRTNTPFLSGFAGPTRKRMIGLMTDNATNYRFLWADIEEFLRQEKERKGERNGPDVFATLPPLQRYSAQQARDSHAHFAKALVDSGQSELLGRVKGWPVTNPEHMVHLGIGTFVTSAVMLVYREEEIERLNRSIDIFIEIPTATFSPSDPDHLHIGDLDHKAWSQLDPLRSTNVFRLWDLIVRHYEENEPPLISSPADIDKLFNSKLPPGPLMPT